jgi:hypothetical protein
MPLNTAPIASKAQMYELLAGGAFGNTIPQFFSVEQWLASPDSKVYKTWGVRTLTPGGPCRLFCPVAEVRATAESYIARGEKINISCMIDAVCEVTLWGEVYDDPNDSGLKVYGIEYPPKGGSWRDLMPTKGRTWEGLAARGILQKHMSPSSLADLWAIFDLWPEHVVEFSAVDRNFGTIPGRNCVVWEVRKY